MKKLYTVFFALALAMTFLFACGVKTSEVVPTDTAEQQTVTQSEVDRFISEYNIAAEEPIMDIAEINITNQESEHYRTEFRLSAFTNAEAKTGKIDDICIDVVGYGYANEKLRIYAYGVTQEQAKKIIKIAAPILDNSWTDADTEDVCYKIEEASELNGYYHGKVGITLIRDELMLKVE